MEEDEDEEPDSRLSGFFIYTQLNIAVFENIPLDFIITKLTFFSLIVRKHDSCGVCFL